MSEPSADPMLPMSLRKTMAWGVHLYTALGLPLAFMASVALAQGDARLFFIVLWVACFVDATDGTMPARRR